MRTLAVAILLACYSTAFYLFFLPVQLRIWNRFGAVDVGLMAALVLPFVLTPLVIRSRHRATRFAWGLAAVMALDVVCFAIGKFAPSGGHPSIESLASYYLALAKPVLLPLALVLLCAGCIRGERMLLVMAGFVCLMGETLYGTYPTEWWSAP